MYAEMNSKDKRITIQQVDNKMNKLRVENDQLRDALDDVLKALKVIHTWASYAGGWSLNPDHVVKLIDRTLEKI